MVSKRGVFGRMEIRQGDITQCNVDALVNAANESLLGGGGVDGAIHRAAGTELLEACRKLGGCPTGGAKSTPGFNLPAQWVIHTVGPVWYGGTRNEITQLAACYRNSLTEAANREAESVAFPAISTGAYHFPPEQAARIALMETAEFLRENTLPKRVIFMCFDAAMEAVYRDIWAEMDAS